MSDSSNQSTGDPEFVRTLVADRLPRIPIKASIDLTYRCNNNCRHCWLWTADTLEERTSELATEEWRSVIDQSRALGVREWAISGGEPLLREDFPEIFEYVTSKATRYSLNTNGTLITPGIARLLKRKGNKMVAIYGATAEVYDHVTRNPGGFEALLQGLSYLKEAGVGFTVQLIPMRDNWHQWEEMKSLAQSWSKHWRVGAAWLFKTACGDAERNGEIERQRLDPADVVSLDPLGVSREAGNAAEAPVTGRELDLASDYGLYGACIESRREYDIDPYGGMSFCSFVKDPSLRFDLRNGSVAEGWEDFIPSLAGRLRPTKEHREGCGSCELRADCRWCGVYGFLEHGVHGARVEYLCQTARENRSFRDQWEHDHVRYFDIAGISIKVESDLPITEDTFDKKFDSFRVQEPSTDVVAIRHHFYLPTLDDTRWGRLIYQNSPWSIYRNEKDWVYLGVKPDPGIISEPHRFAVFDSDHSNGTIYSPHSSVGVWRQGGLHALTMFPTDQILIARILPYRNACLLHSGALAIDGQGLLFVGHSEAGKSTTMELVRRQLGDRAVILCDDRNIVRFWPDGPYVHGTWSHGDVPEVSSLGAPLRAVLFLEQDKRNELVPLTDRKEIWRRLLPTVIKPLVDADWWEREMGVLEQMVGIIPSYVMHFDKTGAIVTELEGLSSA